MALAKLLGDKLTKIEEGKEVTVDVAHLEGAEKVVGLYFSATWCSPCRAFTPHLIQWYDRLREGAVGEKLNIIFVSSDRDEDSFSTYFSSMPWLALPFADRERKTELSRKFKVTGIPTFVLLDASTGELITADGRSIVMEDEFGREFPWKPKPFLDVISSDNFRGPNDQELDADTVRGKVLGLLFSAHWCGPCRSFTPSLIETYQKLKEAGKNFEVILVSSDRDEESWKECFDMMPWIAIPFHDQRKHTLSRMFDIQGIPTLVIVNESGEVITTSGQTAVLEDPDGTKFPWYPEPVRCLTTLTATDINNFPSLIWFNEEVPSDDSLQILTPIAKARIEASAVSSENKMMFYVVGDDCTDDEEEAVSLMRNFARVGRRNPLLVIIDVSGQTVYESDAEVIDADVIKQFVDGFYSRTIKGRPLRP